MNEVTLALLFALGCALTGLTAGGAVGVLGIDGVDGALSDGVVVTSQLSAASRRAAARWMEPCTDSMSEAEGNVMRCRLRRQRW